MTIENLKQIAIKYASTKGSRIPLAPDELCNAVVQYMNSFFGVMTDINTIKVAVTEDSGNILFTITGNTYDGKPITPIVITVDHNDFVTDQEFEEVKTTINAAIQKNTESINSLSFRVEDTESELSEKLDISGGTINGNLTVSGNINAVSYKTRGVEAIGLDIPNRKFDVGNATYGINILSSNRPTVKIGEYTNYIAFKTDIPKYTTVDSVRYDTTNGAIIAYNGANEIHIPLLAGENVTIDASEDNKKIVISAAGGGGTGDVTAAGNNTFTGVNTFNNFIYAKNGVVVMAENSTNYGANNVRKGPNTYSFPNKSGTFAMTTDVIKEAIYFISFYANSPSDSCHLMGTMMSKNSYGTGQKTADMFAVMLADNFYTDSDEGLAVYGKLAGKDILCIFSEDGLSLRCLDEDSGDVGLTRLLFFVVETEL